MMMIKSNRLLDRQQQLLQPNVPQDTRSSPVFFLTW